MCTHPARANILCHADSCLPSLPEVKQWYLPMVSFVSSRCTYCGRILSVPSRSSSLMDVDFANVIYMQIDSVMVLVMSYRQAKQSIFCCLWTILVIPYVIKDAGYVVSLILSVKDFGHHVRIIVSGLAVRCQTFATRYCFAHDMVANIISFLLQCRFRS